MSRSYFHVHRVFHVDTRQGNHGGWYFEVRDGLPHGPYGSRMLAEIALEGYLDDMKSNIHTRDEQGHEAAIARRKRYEVTGL